MATTKIIDKDFLVLLGRKKKIFLDGSDSDLLSKIDIDLQFLVLNKEAAYISFNRPYKDLEKIMGHEKIRSFEIGTGRFGIIIGLNDRKELGLEWSPEDLDRLKNINNNIWIVCR